MTYNGLKNGHHWPMIDFLLHLLCYLQRSQEWPSLADDSPANIYGSIPPSVFRLVHNSRCRLFSQPSSVAPILLVTQVPRQDYRLPALSPWSTKAGGRCVGLSRRRKAGYQTGRMARARRCSVQRRPDPPLRQRRSTCVTASTWSWARSCQ